MVTVLDHDAVHRLQRMLRSIDLGDKILEGRVQLFKLLSRPLEHKSSGGSGYQWLSESVQDVVGDVRWRNNSNLGPMKEPASKLLLIHLTQALCYCFPEHDFDTLTPDCFQRESNPLEVVHSINSHDFSEISYAPMSSGANRGLMNELSVVGAGPGGFSSSINPHLSGPDAHFGGINGSMGGADSMMGANVGMNFITSFWSGVRECLDLSETSCAVYQYLPRPNEFSGLRTFVFLFLDKPKLTGTSSTHWGGQATGGDRASSIGGEGYGSSGRNTQAGSVNGPPGGTTTASGTERRLFFLSCTTRSKCFGVEDETGEGIGIPPGHFGGPTGAFLGGHGNFNDPYGVHNSGPYGPFGHEYPASQDSSDAASVSNSGSERSGGRRGGGNGGMYSSDRKRRRRRGGNGDDSDKASSISMNDDDDYCFQYSDSDAEMNDDEL